MDRVSRETQLSPADVVIETPDTILNRDDPGDDTFRRYRYQATYAAVIALQLLKKTPDIVEVFVEHHDDILLRLASGHFIAVQVKTQQPGGAPFKSGDEPIVKALSKFVRHEHRFSAQFDRYTIATNHHFFRESDNKASLFVLSEQAPSAVQSKSSPDRRVTGFINSLHKTSNKGLRGKQRASKEHVLSALAKLYLDDRLPKLDGIHRDLRDALVNVSVDYRDRTYADLDRAANALAYLTYTKSSLAVDNACYLYVAFVADPQRATEQALISGKRLTPADIAAVLKREMPTMASLAAAESIDPCSIPMDLSVADKKMTAGGLSATTVAAAHDWQASAEYLQRKWAMKYSERTAVERYDHVAAAVQSACAEAHEQTRAESRQGPAMLERLRQCLHERRAKGDDFFDAREEHLLGHAVIRTAQCKVWWSPEFDLRIGTDEWT